MDHSLAAFYFSGKQALPGAQPIAQAYAGHQFGNATMLGDGRAMLLGELITPQQKRFDLQLKGAGPTPFSRRGDGRATLNAVLREHIMSEAMAALGVPTSRSLAVTTTGESVFREQADRKSTRLNSSHVAISYAVFCLKKNTTSHTYA